MTELIFTAYDVKTYLQEALPALKAAIYRADLSQARDILALHDDTLYAEYDLAQTLVENDYSWIFTEQAADLEGNDPNSELIGLTYPLILAYHAPEVFRVTLGGSELDNVLPFAAYLHTDAVEKPADFTSDSGLTIRPGFREGLRAMWEIMGYLSPEDTRLLQQYCLNAGHERALKRSEAAARMMLRLAEGLKIVLEQGYGLVIERE